ncbi:GAF domain-containing sensor histidine kinase [Solirubrobacter ginsenosidimutans]
MTAVAHEVDVEAMLHRLLATAAELTGARYAAVGVLDELGDGLERFVTHGLSDDDHAAIGHLPEGHGLLGAVITDPRPLRVDALHEEPRSAGFPPGHPAMETFLGVPVLIRGEAWGILYLCDKPDGEPFTDADEEAVVRLAEWAAIAIENARNCQVSERRRVELERLVRRLEAATAIARAVGGETDLDRILELIAERGRSLIAAEGLVILLREAGGMVVAAEAGDVPGTIRDPLGLAAAGGTLVPLVFRGQSLGMLVAFGAPGDRADEALLEGFAASAATAVATARSVEERRLREAIGAAEEERRRWARELHDDTLQGLGGLQMLLVASARINDPEHLRAAVRDSIERIEEQIHGLRALIRELRPAALDELGLAAAIEGLAGRAKDRERVEVSAAVHLTATRYAPELETTVYRVIQEALNNAIRHAKPTRVRIAVQETSGVIHICVSDDGQGFDPATPDAGFGLTGMRERISLLRGDLQLASSATGTTVSAAIPAL